jgi:transcriptional regulator with XRE-family HTH domain
MCYQVSRSSFPTDGFRASGGAARSEGVEVKKLIGANLRRLRRQHGLSRRRLARLVQADASALRAIEHGSATPSIGLLWKLAIALEVPCTAFIDGERQIPASSAGGDLGGFFAIA